MDGRLLPSSSECLNEWGAVITQLCWGGSCGVTKRAGRSDDVQKRDKISEKGAGWQWGGCASTVRRSASAAVCFTPLFQSSVPRGNLHFVNVGKQLVLKSTHSLMNSIAGLLTVSLMLQWFSGFHGIITSFTEQKRERRGQKKQMKVGVDYGGLIWTLYVFFFLS